MSKGNFLIEFKILTSKENEKFQGYLINFLLNNSIC